MSNEMNDGREIVEGLILVGSLLPEVDELTAYVEACGREETIGPLFYPDVHRRGQKRLGALRDLAIAGAKFRRAWEALQGAASEESDPELDRAARTLHQGFHDRARRANMGAPEDTSDE